MKLSYRISFKAHFPTSVYMYMHMYGCVHLCACDCSNTNEIIISFTENSLESALKEIRSAANTQANFTTTPSPRTTTNFNFVSECSREKDGMMLSLCTKWHRLLKHVRSVSTIPTSYALRRKLDPFIFSSACPRKPKPSQVQYLWFLMTYIFLTSTSVYLILGLT